MSFLSMLTMLQVAQVAGAAPCPAYLQVAHGLPWVVPQIHHSPNCLHVHGPHDIAAAITVNDTHHVWQLGNNHASSQYVGGDWWLHSTSTDLVHWREVPSAGGPGSPSGLEPRNETYGGMRSFSQACSGFVVVVPPENTVGGDPEVCAGFRQCGSTRGTIELNPDANPWDVPLEVRCATHPDLTQWGTPRYLYPVYFWRPLPYDPVRPWKDSDGKWYSALSTDSCNVTRPTHNCPTGGRLDLWSAEHFFGPWEYVGPMFTTPKVERELITSDYFGGLIGDPDHGRTRVITQNLGHPTFWVGSQQNGQPFVPYNGTGTSGAYTVGMTMARTLGGDTNQVAGHTGRRVQVGWIGGGNPSPNCTSGGSCGIASQSLARDLSLSARYELIQQFVPELKALRLQKINTTDVNHPSRVRIGAEPPLSASMQLEVFAVWTLDPQHPPAAPFGVDVLLGPSQSTWTRLQADCRSLRRTGTCRFSVNASLQNGEIHSGSSALTDRVYGDGDVTLTMHLVVDHGIIEVIWCNRTSLVAYARPPTRDNTAFRRFGAVDPTVYEAWYLASANTHNTV